MSDVRAGQTEGRGTARGWPRRAGVSIALAAFLAFVPVVAFQARAAGKAELFASASTTSDPGRLPELTRNAGAVPVLVASKPIQQTRTGLDLAVVGIVVAGFAVFHRRAHHRVGQRFRCSATFAQRRGPPYFHVAI